MLHTLRAPLIASTVAALSAAAVAVPTSTGAVGTVSPWSADVALTALANPFAELLATGEVAQNYLFGAYYNGYGQVQSGAGEANWPFAGFDQTGGDVLNFLLSTQIALGNYNFVGTLPNNARNAGPVLQQLQVNLFDYINVGLTGLTTAITALTDGVWDYPAALLTAGQLALQGQFAQALGVLTDAVIGPITAAGTSLLDAGGYILNDVVAKVVAVVAAIPQIATTFVGATVGSATVLFQKSAAIFTEWVGKLAQFDLEGAWNVGVAGLLGPSGLPGTVLNLTTGAGVLTGPIQDLATDIPRNFVPSFRTALQSTVWTVANALSATPAAAQSAPAAPSASAVRAPEPAAAQDDSARDLAAVTPPGVENTGPAATRAGAGKDVSAGRGSGDRARGGAGRGGE